MLMGVSLATLSWSKYSLLWLDKASDGIISVPHFDFTATSGGQAFPLMFVGSTPKSGGRTTAITNVIIPLAITVPLLDLDLNFLGTEVTFDGSTKVANTVRSPIYRAARFAVDPRAGKTQWGDAMQRVTFFNSLSQTPMTGTCFWRLRSLHRR
jgi:hypothetical protein